MKMFHERLLREQIGMPPVFDPAKPHDEQIETWKAWSAQMRLVYGAIKLLEEGWKPEDAEDPDKIT